MRDEIFERSASNWEHETLADLFYSSVGVRVSFLSSVVQVGGGQLLIESERALVKTSSVSSDPKVSDTAAY